jgi:IS30 family transposase
MIDDNRIIGCDNLDSILTWIDAAYAVHQNMHSQTGRAMSLGWGTLHARSSKQKLNTKSSTEAELVGLSEYILYNIWLIYFLKAQGYEMKHNIVYQDNQSAIRMARNGHNSCTGNLRHIDIRYFFVKDRIDKGKFEIQYCPTYKMLADYFTKIFARKSFQGI